MEPLSVEEIRREVKLALAEDIGTGDATTLATIPAASCSVALMVAREPLVVAGLAFAVACFRELSDSLELEELARDGDRLRPKEILLRISGQTRAILSGERVALNYVQRLSGVATLTAQFVDAVKGTGAQILDTRKTIPGWRRFEKYAVTCGGGRNHRFGLFDRILIKDNHRVALRFEPPNPIGAAVRRARQHYPNLQVEVEADTSKQVQQALEAGADIILLDNMGLEELRTAVHWVNKRAQVEASGGVTLETVRRIAETGVDFISVGALTHSARAVDLALDFAEP
jgi:nicotinate-nucleotide pyrophosphorylase (carboxylating)